MKSNCLLFIFFLINFSMMGQSATYDKTKISSKTLKIVKKIEKVNVIMGEAVGYGGMRPEQYNNFEKLKETATSKELVTLTNHPNTTVRCYAFQALTMDNKLDISIDLFKIVKEHLEDNEQVETQFGCIGGSESVSDFFVSRVARRDYETDFYMYELDSLQQEEINSLLISNKNDSYNRHKAIGNMEINAQNYPILKALVVEEKNDTALPKLAAYKKEEDIQVILDFHKAKTEKDDDGIYATYLSIQEFPHPVFFSYLKEEQSKIFDNDHFSNEWAILYGAIAKYRNQEALELLQLPFTKVIHSNIKEYHLDFMHNAIMESPSPLYDELLWRLWEDENVFTFDSFCYLFDSNPERAYKNARKEFGITATIENPNLNLDRKQFVEIEDREELILNLLLENEKEIAFDVIVNKIRTENVHDFPMYSRYIEKLKDSVFVVPLFERLRKESNAHIYLEIVTVLLAYKDNAINSEIIKTLDINKNLSENWGGAELKEILLKENLVKN